MGITSNQSPAVIVAEFDLTGVIAAAAISGGAIVGEFNWGPVDHIKTISTETKLNAMFGIPTDTNYLDWFSAKNFLEYSQNLKIVRVVEESARNATALTGGEFIPNESTYVDQFENATNTVGTIAAKYPGDLGNSIKVEIADSYTYTGLDQNTVVITDAGTGYLTADDHDAVVTFSAPAIGTAAEGTLIVVDDIVTGIAITDSGTGYTTLDLVTLVVTIPAPDGAGDTATATIGLWAYKNQFLTSPGTSEPVATNGGSNDELHIIVIDEDGLFTTQQGAILERYAFVSKAAGVKKDDGTSIYYKNVLRDQSAYVYWMAHPTDGTNWGDGAVTDFTSQSILEQCSLISGADGETVTNDERMPGWNMFKNKELVDVGLLVAGAADNALKNYIIQSVAEFRRDCVALSSPLYADVVLNVGDEVEDCLITRNVLTSSSYSIMDCNWKYQFDVHNDTFRWLPCNPDIAGICAKVDYDRDPWWSPAGYNRGHLKNVVKLAWNPDKTDRDELYANGINPVNVFAGEGAILFGDKTMLTKSSAFDRINVRRLFIVLEKSISDAAKYMLFEFNDPATRLKFKLMVEPFLRQVQGGRGIDDFLVVCDESNNTPQVIQTNSFVGDIYVKPNYSINFIHLNFIATPTGITFDMAQALMQGGRMV